MNSYERLKAMTEGKPVDRIGVSGWVHLPYVDMDPKDFPKFTIEITESCGYDLVKMMYNAFFFCEDYGQQLKWWANPAVYSNKTTVYALNHPNDFLKLKVLDPLKPGSALNREIEATKRVCDHFKGKVPVIATLFDPYSQIGQLYSPLRPEMLQRMMEDSPKELKYGLDIIHESSMRFAEELIKAGVDGFFYADMYACNNRVTLQQFNDWLLPYEKMELEELNKKTWFNMLHVHGDRNLLFKEHLDLPFQAINWEAVAPPDTPGLVTLADARAMTDKIIVGGIDHHHDLFIENNDRKKLMDRLVGRVRDAVAAAGKDRLIMGPGCGYPQNPELFFRYPLLKEAVEIVMAEN